MFLAVVIIVVIIEWCGFLPFFRQPLKIVGVIL